MPREPVPAQDLLSEDRHLEPLGPLAPRQIWARLTPPQQQQVRQLLVSACQQWLMRHPDGAAEEKPHADVT